MTNAEASSAPEGGAGGAGGSGGDPGVPDIETVETQGPYELRVRYHGDDRCMEPDRTLGPLLVDVR